MKFCDKKGLPCFYVVGDESLESYTAGISFLFALARRTKTIVVLACPDGILRFLNVWLHMMILRSGLEYQLCSVGGRTGHEEIGDMIQ